MADPAGREFKIATRELKLGRTIEQVLGHRNERWPSEDLLLVIEGVKIQYKIGGNIVQMMEEIAALIRQRVKLEQDIRNMTAQGRLSGIIVTSMVPFSTVMLWMLAPKYSDILRTSVEGHLCLTTAIILTAIGGAVIWRISLVKY